MNERETFHDFSSDLFGSEERSVLEQIRREGRLDTDREVSRLLNILNDILNKHTKVKPEEREQTYSRLKRFLLFEYHKTFHHELEHQEMYVWFLSTLTCLDQFKKQLDPQILDSPEDIYSEFRSVVDGYMSGYLSTFSERNDTRDLGSLMDPEFNRNGRLVNYVNDMQQQHISWESKSEKKTYVTESEELQPDSDCGEKHIIRT